MLNFTYENFDLVFGNFLSNYQGKIKYGSNSVAAITITPVLIIAGTYIVFRYVKNVRKRSRRYEVVYTRSMSLGALHGGKLALQRLIDYHHARSDSSSLNAAETEFRTQLAQKQPDYNKLQSIVAKLEMAGKEAVAVRVLEKEVEKAKFDNRSHESYELQMLLVEALIYKGDYQKALRCECLNHEEISDARRPPYKAIIHIMLNHNEEASSCWDEFVEVRSYLLPTTSVQEHQIEKQVGSFNEFDKLVNILKIDIASAHI